MAVTGDRQSIWERVLGYPDAALMGVGEPPDITDIHPDRTLGVWLNLTPESLAALDLMCAVGLKLLQQHNLFLASRSGTDVIDPNIAPINFRIAAFEVAKKMHEFPLEGGTIVFTDDEKCPDIIIQTITEARLDTDDAADCIPADPEE